MDGKKERRMKIELASLGTERERRERKEQRHEGFDKRGRRERERGKNVCHFVILS